MSTPDASARKPVVLAPGQGRAALRVQTQAGASR